MWIVITLHRLALLLLWILNFMVHWMFVNISWSVISAKENEWLLWSTGISLPCVQAFPSGCIFHTYQELWDLHSLFAGVPYKNTPIKTGVFWEMSSSELVHMNRICCSPVGLVISVLAAHLVKWGNSFQKIQNCWSHRARLASQPLQQLFEEPVWFSQWAAQQNDKHSRGRLLRSVAFGGTPLLWGQWPGDFSLVLLPSWRHKKKKWWCLRQYLCSFCCLQVSGHFFIILPQLILPL